MKSSRREYIILGAVIVVSVLLLFLNRSGKVNYRLPDLPQLEDEDIQRIEIQTPETTLEIARQENRWLVGENQYPADSGKVQEILKATGQLQITELISGSGDYHRYGLDEEKQIGVKVFGAEDKLLRELVIGEASATSQHTYVRFPGDDNVYHARDSFRYQVNQSVDDLRDKTVLKFDQDEISGIDIGYDDQTLELEKSIAAPESPEISEADSEDGESVPPVVSWIDEQGKKMDSEAVDLLLSTAADLTCAKYLDSGEVENLIRDERILYRIRFNGDRNYELKIYEKLDEDQQQYPSVSSENEYPFYLSSYTAEEVMKKRDDLVEKPAPEEPEEDQ